MRKKCFRVLSTCLIFVMVSILCISSAYAQTNVDENAGSYTIASTRVDWDGDAGSYTIQSTKHLLGTYPSSYSAYLFDGSVDGNLGWISKETAAGGQINVYINFTSYTFSTYYGQTVHYEYVFYYYI